MGRIGTELRFVVAGGPLGLTVAVVACGASPTSDVVILSPPADRPPQVTLPAERDPSAPHARCLALPEPRERHCSPEARADDRATCDEIFDVHLPEVAEAAIRCFADQCGRCPMVVCRWQAIEGASGRGLASCDDVSPPPFADACNRYAASLSRKGRRRLTTCLAAAEGLKTECYTEPALTPCSSDSWMP